MSRLSFQYLASPKTNTEKKLNTKGVNFQKLYLSFCCIHDNNISPASNRH